MLLWLICCKRPMTLQELAFAIAIDPEDKQLDKNKVFFRDDLLLDICGSLVKVRETRQWKKVVEFSHFSVLEYLTTKLPSGLSHEFFIDQKAGHAEIMKCCLAYISFPQLMRRYHNIDHNRPQQVEFYLHDEELLTRERCVEHEFNFMKYASQYWYFHAKEVEHDSTARQAIRDFIENAQHDVFEAWSMVWRRELINTMGAPIHFPISHPARDGLSYAAFLGLHHVVGDLLKEDTLGNSIRYSRNAAMVAAVHDMSSKSLGQLIEAGVNIEHRDEKGLVVLLYAVSVGNVKAVEMLLRANADITARDIHGYFYTYGKGYTALHIAAQYGRTEVCKLLLDNGASVRDLDDADGTPLFAAVCRGLWSRPNVVRVLLKAGSSIRHFNMNGETVLDVAIQAGDTEVINILVEAGATVTATDNMTGFSVD